MIDSFLNLWDGLAEWARQPDFKTALVTFKWVFYVLTLAFIGLIIWLRYKALYFADLKRKYFYYLPQKKRPEHRPGLELPLQSLKEYWSQVVTRLNYQDDAQWKLAVIEADNFFDHVLNLLGYEGESMGERLQKIAPHDLKNLNDIWQVHKIRNALVHDPTFRLAYNQAESVINTYEQALQELKIIE